MASKLYEQQPRDKTAQMINNLQRDNTQNTTELIYSSFVFGFSSFLFIYVLFFSFSSALPAIHSQC